MNGAPWNRIADIHNLMPGTAQATRRNVGFVAAIARRRTGCDPDRVETVLAEVLNNVVEHACRNRAGHVVGLEVWLLPRDIWVRVTDDGLPMPGAQLPEAKATPPEALPEGGFGLSLIRRLARDLRYRREDGRNILTFRVSAETAPRVSAPRRPAERRTAGV
ncbi:ATP-binding protein [Maritimibacter sp. 55A14]|uniref:ATP-binding protein n=1 Tax=Maritimibacter sp. 55A14 TaxID=2174844 RepID=UPI00130496EF|nr:ATP-binding protein [Maritimibacter sp. 55A14]